VTPREVSELGLRTSQHPLAARTAGSTKPGAAFGLAGLFVELTNADFLFDATALDELAKAANGLLGSFFVP